MNVATAIPHRAISLPQSRACDAQDWDTYLEMFSEDSEFHLPQWDSEHVYTTDPKNGMSLIYYPNRGGLEDRVFRIRTGKAASTIPMPRTLHLISNVRIAPLRGRRPGSARQLAAPCITACRPPSSSSVAPPTDCGPTARAGRSPANMCVLLNDTINSVLDFYHL